MRRLNALLGEVTYQIGVADLTGSYLADFDLVVVPLGLNPAERVSYDADQRLFSDLNRRFRQLYPQGTWQELVSVASQSAEGRSALAAWRRTRRLISFTSAKARAVGTLLERHRGSASWCSKRQWRRTRRASTLIMPMNCDSRGRARARARMLSPGRAESPGQRARAQRRHRRAGRRRGDRGR